MPRSSLRHQFFNYINGCAFAALSMYNLMAFADPKNQTVDLSSVAQNIKILASDAFEGRGPLTQGEQLTIEYLAQQYKKLGLKGANPNSVGSSPLGQYFQAVPIAQIIPDQNMKLVIGDLSFTSVLNATPLWGSDLPFWDGRLPGPAIPRAIGRAAYDSVRDSDNIKALLEKTFADAAGVGDLGDRIRQVWFHRTQRLTPNLTQTQTLT